MKNKKTIIIITLLVLLSINTYAAYIGGFQQLRYSANLTINSTSLEIFTSNTSRLYISKDGLVGIGTITPTAMSDVAQGATTSTNIDHNDTAFTDGFAWNMTSLNVTSVSGFPESGTLVIDSEAISYTGIDAVLNTFTGLTRGALATAAANHTNNTAVYFMTSSVTRNTSLTPYTVVRSDGNVGIGTAAPTHLLTVAGDLNVTGASYLGDIVIKADNITLSEVVAKDENITFFNATRGELIRITPDGKVGIGIPDPAHKLEVNGSINATNFYGDGSNLDGIRKNASYNYVYDGSSWIGMKGTTAGVLQIDVLSQSLDTVSGDLTVTNDLVVTGSADISGGLNVTGNVQVIGDLNVTGTTYLGSMDFKGGNLTATLGTFTTLNVTGTSYLGSMVFESGNITASLGTFTNLNVTGTSYLGSMNFESGNITATLGTFTNLNVTGTSYLGSMNFESGNITATRGTFTELNVTGTSYLGNATIHANSFLGQNANVSLLNVSGTAIFSSGNVGIGTSTPTHLLTVAGDLNVTGASYLGDIIIQADNMTVNEIVSRNENISFFNASKDEKMRITYDGKVGIGTTNPLEALTIIGNANISGMLNATAIYQDGNLVIDTLTLDNGTIIRDSNTSWVVAIGSLYNRQNFTADYALEGFKIENMTGVYANFTTLNVSGQALFTSGNVGIGTSTPTHLLTVAGDLNVTGASYLGDIVISADNLTVNEIVSKDENISFFNATKSEKMRITNSGNVGIGTTNPANGLLDIQSSVANSPNIYLENSNGDAIDFRSFQRTNAGANIFGLSRNGLQYISFNPNGVAVVGTENAKDLLLATNDAVRVNISSGGNVGIGGDPGVTERLLIQENSNAAVPQVYLVNNVDGTGAEVVLSLQASESTGTIEQLATGYTTNGGFVADGMIIRANANAAGGMSIISQAAAPIRFYTGGFAAGNERMRIDEDGNVGIGTTAPSDNFEIAEAGTNSQTFQYITTYNDQANYAPGLFIRKSNSDTLGTLSATQSGDRLGMLTFQGVNTGSGWTAGARIMALQSGAGGATYIPTDITFLTSTNAADITEVMRITSAGNVGIGTASPGSEYGFNPMLTIEGSGSPGIVFNDTNGDEWSIGTSSSNLNIAAGATERLRIDSSGNVGIGTTAPKEKLVVVGGVNITNGANISNGLNVITGNVGIGTTSPSLNGPGMEISGSSGSTELRITSTANQQAQWRVSRNQNGGSYNTDWYGYIPASSKDLRFSDGSDRITFQLGGNVGIGTTGPSYLLQINDVDKALNVSDVLYVNGSSGNVGIGTTAPSSKLHLKAATTDGPVIIIENDAASNNRPHVRFFDSSEGMSFALGINDATNTFSLGYGTDGTTTPETNTRLSVDTSGNVGIGTTSPSEELEINGNSVLVELNDTGDTNPQIRFVNDVTRWEVGMIGTQNDEFFIGNAGGQDFTILTSGNVGIGTTTPATTLDVGGGDFTVNATSGNVGIGTTGPDTRLTIGGATAQRLKILDNSGNDNVVLGNTGSAGAAQLTLYKAGVATVHITTDAVQSGSSTYFNAGNVGIGTTSPSRKLDITASDDVYIELNRTSATTRSFLLGVESGKGFVIYDAEIPAYRMVIDGTGNVGIGTTTPTAKLEVTENSSIAITDSGLYRTEKARVDTTNPTDIFRFLDADGTVMNGAYAGTIYVTALASGGNTGSEEWRILTTSNGVTNAKFTLVDSQDRGTSPINTLQIVADGGSGAVKIQMNATASIPATVRTTFIGSAY